MNNYIQIYKNVIDPKYCDELIKKFESNSHQYDKQTSFPMSFTQINLNQHNEWKQDVENLVQVYLKYLKQYKKDCNVTAAMWPTDYAFEQIRLKRYLPDGVDEFGSHVDAIDLESSIRFLVFFLYLDDNEQGQTHFVQLGQASPCTKGSLLMFPPFWPWLHAGAKPIKKPKYILGSYLHYNN
tara:strand:- start:46 stop:591 length:546 start_codon:yes stop_codon:yes gene_type:complete